MAFCTHCGKPLQENARFCVNCGAPVAAPAAPEAPEAQPPVEPTPVETPVESKPEAPSNPMPNWHPVEEAPAQESPVPPVTEPIPPQPEAAPQAQPQNSWQAPPPPPPQAQPQNTRQTPPPPPQQPPYGAAQAPYGNPQQPYGQYKTQQAPRGQQVPPYGTPNGQPMPPYGAPQGFHPPQPQKPKKKTGLIIGIIAAVVVLGLIIALIALYLGGSSSLKGVYIPSEATMYGEQVDPDLIMGDHFSLTIENGKRCVLRYDDIVESCEYDLEDDEITILTSFGVIKGTVSDDEILLKDIYGIDYTMLLIKGDEDDIKYPYADEDDEDDNDLPVQVDATQVPVLTEPEVDAATEAPAEIQEPEELTPPFQSETQEISVPSEWFGSCTISNYMALTDNASGFDSVEDVWASIGTANDGRIYFEIYSEPYSGNDDVIISSMWVNIDDDNRHMRADIGANDAWIFQQWLTASDEIFFDTRLTNGALILEYYFQDADQSFTVTFFLREDGASWDFENDPLPPSLAN